ncbi:MAG TPA: Hsp70 family protein [Bryobacteraceae bacterium]|nr:Hsp70 family protein [Bryobacteraceae bacterium]
MSSPVFTGAVIGIDLGTTNCAIARSTGGPVEILAIPQLTGPGELREEPLFPSSLYLHGPREFAEGATALPWDPAPPYILGEWAKRRGVENASRLVHSAKSWLSHAGVDRTAPLLPLTAPEGVNRISPLDASTAYLSHLRHALGDIGDSQVLITVPASFDASARSLTEQAAQRAGFANFVLLEEPQAAFYAWLERHEDWRQRVHAGDRILVIDIGGGTTDFTLIAAGETNGELTLERVAVGEHILLGGDNLDLALARAVEQELAAKNTRLDAMQLHMLWQRCRAAKEKLLAPGAAQSEEAVTILGRGTGLIGGSIKATLRRETLEQILLEGFLPPVGRDEQPARARRAALAEVGLPYASDPRITAHLARFIQQAGAPTHILFNGGVLHAPIVRRRIIETLNGWLDKPIQVLEGEDLMHAVARGAAYYGLARQGKGIRIRGGVARTYYIGIESSMPAVPGMPSPMKALAVVPFGLEEGSSVELPKQEFGLLTGEPAEFRFFSSVARREDKPGDVLDPIPPGVEELSPVEVSLPAASESVVRVTLAADVTATGVLELWCVAKDGNRWKLEFNVREQTQ